MLNRHWQRRKCSFTSLYYRCVHQRSYCQIGVGVRKDYFSVTFPQLTIIILTDILSHKTDHPTSQSVTFAFGRIYKTWNCYNLSITLICVLKWKWVGYVQFVIMYSAISSKHKIGLLLVLATEWLETWDLYRCIPDINLSYPRVIDTLWQATLM